MKNVVGGDDEQARPQKLNSNHIERFSAMKNALFLLLTILPAWANAEVRQQTIFDNTINSLCCGYVVGLYPSSSDVYIDTFPFTVQGSSYQLREVSLLASGAAPGGLSLFLYEDAGGKPGAVLESWQGVSAGSTVSRITTNSVKRPILEDGKQYWFGVSTTNPSETAIWWINPGAAVSAACSFANGTLLPCLNSLATGAFTISGMPLPGNFH